MRLDSIKPGQKIWIVTWIPIAHVITACLASLVTQQHPNMFEKIKPVTKPLWLRLAKTTEQQ